MTSFSIQPIAGPWLVVLIAAVLLGLLFLGPARQRMTGRQRLVLAVLRAIVSCLLVFVILRPAVVYTDVRQESASLVLLIDTSRSLQVTDALGGKSRWDSLREHLGDAADQLAALGDDFDVRPYGFARDVVPLSIESGTIELPEVPEGNQTAIGAALEDTLQREAAGRMIAVLLFGDGAQRAYAPRDAPPERPVRQLDSQGVPLYTFVFGGSGGTAADLALTNLLVPETLFAEMPTEISGELRVRGYGSQDLQVQLMWETSPGQMTPVDTQVVTAVLNEDGLAKIPVTFRHAAQVPGEYKVAVRAVPQQGERVVTNNTLSTFVRVRKGGVKILLLDGGAFVGGGPLPEQRGVRWALATSPDLTLDREHFNYETLELDLRDDLAPGKHDVLLLLNVDATALSRETWQAAREWVGRGGGLMMAGGEHSFGPGGFRRGALQDVLPIEIGPAERQNFGEPTRTDVHVTGQLGIRPTRLGERHWVMDLGMSDQGKLTWDDVPPLDGANRIERTRIKPGASVLAETADDRRLPLLVTGNWGAGRVLAFAGDSTEKWRRHGRSDVLKRFWRQAILWLAKKDEAGENEVWIRLPQRRMLPGETMTFAVGANSAQDEPIADADFKAELELPDGSRRPLELNRRGGEVLGRLALLNEPGDYSIHVTAAVAGEPLGAATTRFLIEDHDLELDNPAADAELLRRLARITDTAGGNSLAPEQLTALLDELADRKVDLTQEYMRKVTLWDRWPIFLALVGLLSVEWYLRKRWGLV